MTFRSKREKERKRERKREKQDHEMNIQRTSLFDRLASKHIKGCLYIPDWLCKLTDFNDVA